MTSAVSAPGPDFDAVKRLHKELDAESDRGVILVSSAMLEEALRELLIVFLAPNFSSADALLDGANGPLSSFSSKVDVSYRVGLISDRFARDLHLIRKVRNDVAHRPAGCDFSDSSVKDRIAALSKSHGIFERSPGRIQRWGYPTVREQFIEAVSWMLFFLAAERRRVKPIAAHAAEFGYMVSLDDESTWPKPGE
ncbi:MltR family transcriptional regulator [Lysobacter sp. KIS68-7]|uniref:MltR family transcriptional regulator n=1 Tax=Lysobacter sp. KIS68-7 TaxID=2904252 RepID=UPI001E2F6523|nr:MltR family transcriptional regulator [Lysobacter sp. KIS68-7]UHQ19097.1 MltR family transcriptional regulator [Lysobacter sp. KIS68-7]